MTQNGGSGALPTAVNNFIQDFNGTTTDSNSIDYCSRSLTFGNTQQRNGCQIPAHFQSKILCDNYPKLLAGGEVRTPVRSRAGGWTEKEILFSPKRKYVRVWWYFSPTAGQISDRMF